MLDKDVSALKTFDNMDTILHKLMDKITSKIITNKHNGLKAYVFFIVIRLLHPALPLQQLFESVFVKKAYKVVKKKYESHDTFVEE